MSTNWHSVEGTFRRNRSEVAELCKQYFGQEYKEKQDPISLKVRNNHGNWRTRIDGSIQFRYQKDATWFILMAGHLADPVEIRRSAYRTW